MTPANYSLNISIFGTTYLDDEMSWVIYSSSLSILLFFYLELFLFLQMYFYCEHCQRIPLSNKLSETYISENLLNWLRYSNDTLLVCKMWCSVIKKLSIFLSALKYHLGRNLKSVWFLSLFSKHFFSSGGSGIVSGMFSLRFWNLKIIFLIVCLCVCVCTCMCTCFALIYPACYFYV